MFAAFVGYSLGLVFVEALIIYGCHIAVHNEIVRRALGISPRQYVFRPQFVDLAVSRTVSYLTLSGLPAAFVSFGSPYLLELADGGQGFSAVTAPPFYISVVTYMTLTGINHFLRSRATATLSQEILRKGHVVAESSQSGQSASAAHRFRVPSFVVQQVQHEHDILFELVTLTILDWARNDRPRLVDMLCVWVPLEGILAALVVDCHIVEVSSGPSDASTQEVVYLMLSKLVETDQPVLKGLLAKLERHETHMQEQEDVIIKRSLAWILVQANPAIAYKTIMLYLLLGRFGER